MKVSIQCNAFWSLANIKLRPQVPTLLQKTVMWLHQLVNFTLLCRKKPLLLADAGVDEEQEVEQERRNEAGERDPGGDRLRLSHRRYEPVSLVRVGDDETVGDLERCRVDHGEGHVHSHHGDDGDR